MKNKFFSIIVFLLIWVGCAPSVMVSTQSDNHYQFHKNIPIFLKLGVDVNIEEKKLFFTIKKSLESSGLNVVENLEQAQVVLTFKVEKKNYQQVVWNSTPVPMMYNPFWGNSSWGWGVGTPMWGAGYSFGYPQTYMRNNYVYLHEEKILKFRLFEQSDFSKGNLVPVWEGQISADSKVMNDDLEETLSIIIDKIGKDYSGRIELKNAN